jgi:hypothetical protein
MNARSCTSREGYAGFSHVPDAALCSPNRVRYANSRYREKFDTRGTQNADQSVATRPKESLDMKKRVLVSDNGNRSGRRSEIQKTRDRQG